MGDMLADGAAFLAETQRAHVSRAVRYRRPSESRETAALTVTVGSTDFEQMGDTGAAIVVQSADWIVATADLRFDDGTTFEPRRGDLVEDAAVAGRVLTYEVRAPGNEPPWRYADRHRRQVRIHSSQARSEAAP